MRNFLKNLIALSTLALACGVAQADNWGCEVLLCLSNPNGPTAVAECKPPIEKLWKELAKLKPKFPTCSMQDANGNDLGPSASTNAQHQWANGFHCPPPYVMWQNIEGMNMPMGCQLSGAITVTIDGSPFTKVWWSMANGGTVTEYNAAGGPAAAEYAAVLATYNAEQEAIKQQQQWLSQF